MITRHEASQRERGRDLAFWKDFPDPWEVAANSNIGLYFNEECLLPPVMASNTANYGYHSYQDAGNTIAPADTYPGGVWELATDGTDEDEVHLQVGGVTGGMYYFSSTSGHNHDQWFETVVDMSRVTNGANSFFVGLAEKASAVADHLTDATGALQTTRAVVGFHTLAAAAATVRCVYNTGAGTVVNLGTGDTKVVGTYTRYGIRYRKLTGKCEYWVNGVLMFSVAISTSNFPDAVNLTPMWGHKSNTATATSMYVDRWTYGLIW
jgi:hypothetical protein